MIGPAPGIRLKVCMAGEAAVGKTSLIRRYVLHEYDDRYRAPLGTKITKKTLTVQDPKAQPLDAENADTDGAAAS